MYVLRYDLMCSPSMNETVIAQRAQWFKDHGFDKLGYEYVNLDDCFIAKGTCAILGILLFFFLVTQKWLT